MSSLSLDCSGLPCPGPVLECKKAVEDSTITELEVVVDNDAAMENVTRFLERSGFSVSGKKDGAAWNLQARRNGARESEECGCSACEAMSDEELDIAASKVVVFITSDAIGRGDDALGAKLMVNFLSTLPELGPSFWRLVLVNGGVKLAVSGHACLEKIQSLAQSGVEVLVCGTCLDHFGLLEKKEVGETTNMLDVVTSLQLADKIIQI